ncbi:hypothetical protein ILFOPFJJ_05681 [Ensifer psoraleae]|nr:hypothetical protein [Sinorhizobium psoraleae]
MAPVTVRMKDGCFQVFASVNDALEGGRATEVENIIGWFKHAAAP